MCQQTQVATVMPYFERWMARFPTVRDLAEAGLHDVHSHWQGLGYYRRADLLHSGARWVSEHGWPRSYDEWRKVPGVGDYTAGAIASISLGESVAAVDGNVVRVFARFTANDHPFQQVQREAQAWARKVMPTERPGDWNQALMELGALICRPKSPKCDECPIHSECAARSHDPVSFPTAKIKPIIIERTIATCVPVHGERIGLTQDREENWWRGLWTFPALMEFDDELDRHDLPSVRHTVTNHRLTFAPTMIRLSKPSTQLTWFGREELKLLPIPAAHRKILSKALTALDALPKFERV